MTKKKLEALFGGDTKTIELETDEAGLNTIRLGDKTFTVDSQRVEPDVWSLIIGGESYEATIQPLKNNKLRVTLRGATWDIDVYDPRRKRSGAAAGGLVEGAQVVSSPMPGRVVKIEVAVGDKVEPGQGVVIVEAMKMENELNAEVAGTVKEIQCEEGQAVEDGQTLIVIE